MPERDARRSGYPCLRLLPGSIRTHVVSGRGEEPGEADRRRPEGPLRCAYRRLYGEATRQIFRARARLEQHAINKTVNRVHQAMEAFIHNMNTIHSRGGNQVVFSSYQLWYRYQCRGPLHHARNSAEHLRWRGQWRNCHLPYPDMEEEDEASTILPEDRNYDLYQLGLQGNSPPFLP